MDESKRKRFIISFIMAGVFGYILLMIADNLYYDPRPFVSSGIQPLFQHSADNGFPSDHTTVSALAAFIVFVFSRKIGIVMSIFAFMIGAARVFAHVHSWIDILGAIVIALITAGIAVFLSKAILIKIMNGGDNEPMIAEK